MLPVLSFHYINSCKPLLMNPLINSAEQRVLENLLKCSRYSPPFMELEGSVLCALYLKLKESMVNCS
jgi:hypothetical protein